MESNTLESLTNFCMRIEAERNFQLNKWGNQNHHYDFWLVILAEEFGELAKAICERKPVENIVKELVQVATVCQAIYQEGHY